MTRHRRITVIIDLVASRFLTRLADQAPMITALQESTQRMVDQRVMVDIDDTIIEVHGYTKQARATATPGSAA